jgi:glucosamine--fructose-6-phosphate aminotransferase (isomerizing)
MGYVGPRQAAPLLLDGLRRLEYRGYDSAGVAVANGSIKVLKAEGKIDRLSALLEEETIEGSVGIGHTRWATHGEPNDRNAHPHTDPSGRFVVVHNGIIENFAQLRAELESDGHEFSSDTDSEILAHLVARRLGDHRDDRRRCRRPAHPSCRLECRAGGEGRLRALHAQGDPRAA